MSLNALLVCKDAAPLASSSTFRIPTPPWRNPRRPSWRKSSAPVSFPLQPPHALAGARQSVARDADQEFGIKPWDAAEVTKATVHARGEMNRIVNALRALGGPWEGIQVAATAEQIGVRDGRRIRGRYVVTQEDIVNGGAPRRRRGPSHLRRGYSRRHRRATTKRGPSKTRASKVKPYDIPLRALIARDVDGLMMAGRCISGDFIAHASYRVTGNSTSMGEAAGAVAALAEKASAPLTRSSGAKPWLCSQRWASGRDLPQVQAWLPMPRFGQHDLHCLPDRRTSQGEPALPAYPPALAARCRRWR